MVDTTPPPPRLTEADLYRIVGELYLQLQLAHRQIAELTRKAEKAE